MRARRARASRAATMHMMRARAPCWPSFNIPRYSGEMLFQRRTTSGAIIAALTALLTVEVTCQGQAAEVLIPLENQTVILREEGHFFCQVLGNDPKIRIDGRLKGLPFFAPGDLNITIDNGNSSLYNITIVITATKRRNNTLLECYDATMDRAEASRAMLTIQGGPAEPEVRYEILWGQNDVLLSWPRPFTWENYTISGYRIKCTNVDMETMFVSNAENRPIINHTVKLTEEIPECDTLQCNVTAFNALDESTPSVTDIAIPLMKLNPRPNLQLVKAIFAAEQEPELVVCVTLPALCAFQNVTYTIIFSQDGAPVLELLRGFSYSSGDSSECIEELVTTGLQEGQEYTVHVFVDAGQNVNASSAVETFKFPLYPDFETEGSSSPEETTSTDSEDKSETIDVIDIALAAMLLVVVVIVIILATIILCMCRALKHYRHRALDSSPTGATNKVFEAYHLSKMDSCGVGGTDNANAEPFYHTLEASTGNQYVNQQQPTEPLYHNPIVKK